MSTLRTASLSGANSNEFYSLHYPDSILRFCSFDFSNFIRRCTEFYNRCNENGEFFFDDAVSLKNSISACHKYYEVNIHGIFDKIVLDFIIEYMCRDKGIGTSALWNNLISPKNGFEKEIFRRLTEYRHNKATNQWVNLLKIQEYAKRKLDFVFSEDADVSIASAKRDYFDLTFSIAANEMGYSSNAFTGTKLYSVGRLPSAPFIIGKVAKEIESTTLAGVQFPDEAKETVSPVRCDADAMEVFSAIKSFIPAKTDSVFNMVINTMRSMPKKVYIAESFKAVIDLEIDLLLESKAVLRHCKRCGAYYLRDKEYDFDFCDNVSANGKSCLELSSSISPKSFEEMQELERRVSDLYSYMSKRINVDLTQREFAEWYQHFMAIKENIAHHKVSVQEFADFENYSKELKFEKPSVQNEIKQPEKPAEEPKADERVKPFVFERVDRSELYEQETKLRKKREREAEEEELRKEITPSIEDIAQDAKPTVKVMKASDAPQASEITVFENPFDGAFDESIDKAENEVKSREFKPLDDIFDFGAEKNQPEKAEHSSEIQAKPAEEKPSFSANSAIEALKKRYSGSSKPAEEKPAAAEETSFDMAFSKASYMRENRPITKSGYVAGMYKKTAEETAISDSSNDIDILPESVVEEKPKKAPPVIQLNVDKEQTSAESRSEKPAGVSENSAIARLRAAAAASARDEERARNRVPADELQRNNIAAKKAEPEKNTASAAEPKYTTSKTKRVLDGIMNPVKNHNPFIDE